MVSSNDKYIINDFCMTINHENAAIFCMGVKAKKKKPEGSE